MNGCYAIVVLGARVEPGGRPSPSLEDRLVAASVAYASGRAPRVVVTGRGEAGPMRDWLVQIGVPAEAILVEPAARTTRENARQVAALVPAGAELLVVTQPSHLPRALALFHKHGLAAIGLPAEERWTTSQKLRERVSWFCHRLFGWI